MENQNLSNTLIISGRNLQKIPVCNNDHENEGRTITYMDLSHNQITHLNGLEKYPKLETLILDSNLIQDLLDLPILPSLVALSLNKNKIDDLDHVLKVLSQRTTMLRFLSLLGNSCCPNQLVDPNANEYDYHWYRCYVKYSLPGIKFLDSTPITVKEREEALLRGQFLRIAKPIKHQDDKYDKGKNHSSYPPLPPAKSNLSTHKGIYGACRYRYTGKNSEGNRFIRNNDL